MTGAVVEGPRQVEISCDSRAAAAAAGGAGGGDSGVGGLIDSIQRLDLSARFRYSVRTKRTMSDSLPN